MTGIQYARCGDCRKKRKIEVTEVFGVRFARDVDNDEPWIFVEAEEHRGREPHGWYCENCGPDVAHLV